MPSILVFGATGFVGGDSDPYTTITLCIAKIKALSKEHDIVINAGNSFTSEPVAAIVAGLKERQSAGKGKLIHITGYGNFIDMGTSGNFNPESKVWNNENEDDIKSINDKMFNGLSDTVVLEAGKGNSIETHIVCIGVMCGGSTIQSKSVGVGYNILIGNAKQLGYVPYVGDGSAFLTTTRVIDAVDFLTKLVDTAAQTTADRSTCSRWYNVQAKRVTWKELATELTTVLHDKGILQSREPKNVSIDEAGEGEVKYLVGPNMLMQGPRAVKMGFVSNQPSIIEQMQEDLKYATL